ncbi:unnamed protein product, partial [Laminaria digitata]
ERSQKRPRRASRIIPENVISKVPRLVVDLAALLGCKVSTEEAKAACRELDRCGDSLNQEELGTACMPILLRRGGIFADGVGGVAVTETGLGSGCDGGGRGEEGSGDAGAAWLVPDSVMAKVPRLALDLETFLGRPVSEGEAAASCRELDRCGAFSVVLRGHRKRHLDAHQGVLFLLSR